MVVVYYNVYLQFIIQVYKLNKMYSTRIKKEKKSHDKKVKLSKLINNSDSEDGESEHELSYYINDRVKLMKEVLKIIKPKKIKCMAPTCMKNLDNEEINSMLLEELLGISNKRLKYIFNGQNLDEDSSSTDPEDDQNPVDVISLDDISDDDFVVDLNSDSESTKKRCKKHRLKIKEEPNKEKKVKKEKRDKGYSQHKSKELVHDTSEQNLMSVLELLELQARARAIRSQLALENNKKANDNSKLLNTVTNEQSDDDVIVEIPKNEEIVITSSDSEIENHENEKEYQDKNSQDKDGKTNNDCKTSEEKNSVQEVNMVENVNETEYNSNKTSRKDQTDLNKHHESSSVQRKCRRKHRTKYNRTSSKVEDSEIQRSRESNPQIATNKTEVPNNNESHITTVTDAGDKLEKNFTLVKEKVEKQEKHSLDEGEGIVLNVDQSEMECIYLD